MAQNEDGGASSSARPPLKRLRLSRNRNASNHTFPLQVFTPNIYLVCKESTQDCAYPNENLVPLPEHNPLVMIGNGHDLSTESMGQSSQISPLQASQSSLVPRTNGDEHGVENVGHSRLRDLLDIESIDVRNTINADVEREHLFSPTSRYHEGINGSHVTDARFTVNADVELEEVDSPASTNHERVNGSPSTDGRNTVNADVGLEHMSSSTSRNRDGINSSPSIAVRDNGDLTTEEVAAPSTSNEQLIRSVSPTRVILEAPVVTTGTAELPLPGMASTDVEQEMGLPAEIQGISGKPNDVELEKFDTGNIQELDSNEVDALVCPICMEPWTNSGDHRICSLACGHLFGKSCIERWLQQAGRKYSKCPQCNKRAKWEDLRTLYVPRVAVVDGGGQQLLQEVHTLRVENRQLKLENAMLLEKMHRSKDKFRLAQALLLQASTNSLSESHQKKVCGLDATAGSCGAEVRDMGIFAIHARQNHTPSQFGLSFRRREFNSKGIHGRNDDIQTVVGRHGYGQMDMAGLHSRSSSTCMGSGDNFVLQHEIHMRGGKVFDMDAESQMVIVSNKSQGCGSNFGLTKIGLLGCTEVENIGLPSGFGATRDIRLSPSGIGGPGKLALVASIGKKLSVVSLESNNIVLTYSVQSPPWSCAWDPCVPNRLYSGLQNGSLLVFDLRQTSSPIAVLTGPSMRPIHTLQAVPYQKSIQAGGECDSSEGRGVLGGSSSGIFLWDLGSSAATSEMLRPYRVCSHKEKLCVSLVYERSSDTAVASFRPSPLATVDALPSCTPGLSVPEMSSQPADGPSECGTSATANNPFHWVFVRGQENPWPLQKDEFTVGADEIALGRKLRWGWVGEMVGHKSQTVMSRTAIIAKWNSNEESKSLFACGDEGTNAVWLWDMESFRVKEMLIPHQSPVLDVKNIKTGGRDLMGCVSERTFQLYQRVPLAN